MKAAVFAKPGFSHISEELVKLLSQFDTVYTVEDFNGALFNKILRNAEQVVSYGFANGYVTCIDYNVSEILKRKVDVIVSVGGDGMAAYIACALIKQVPDSEKRPSMLGWAAGTANVGPIVSRQTETDLSEYRKISFDAVEVKQGDKILGYAFNDVIIGNSFLGTKDNKFVNLDARAMAETGKQIVCSPCNDILTEAFKVRVNSETFGDSSWKKYCQVCISSLQDTSFLSGRAVFGGMINAAGMDAPAVITFMDRIAVDSNPDSWYFKGPVESRQICFDSSDTVEISGFTDNAQIIIDGNPFVRDGDVICIKNIKNALFVLRSNV